MTLDEARGGPELALWSGSREEFLLNPDSGVIWWRPVGETGVLHGNSWQPTPKGVIVPVDGWRHHLDCDCPYCQ